MHILLILCYNGSLVTWTVVMLTAAKFKPLIFSGFALSYAANMFICMTSARIHTEGRNPRADRCLGKFKMVRDEPHRKHGFRHVFIEPLASSRPFFRHSVTILRFYFRLSIPNIFLRLLSFFWKNEIRLMRAPCSLCVCLSPYKLLNAWTNMYEIWYVYHEIWTHLNVVFHKSLRSVCVSVFVFPLLLLGNDSVYTLPRQRIHETIDELLNASFSVRSVPSSPNFMFFLSFSFPVI
jgi:hypothetical protein